jgi:hypothetical protein
MGNFHEDQYTFMILSRWILLWIRNVSEKSCRENQNKTFYVQIFFSPENWAVYELMWKGMVEADGSQMTI